MMCFSVCPQTLPGQWQRSHEDSAYRHRGASDHSSLQKRRINRKTGIIPPNASACRKGYRMLFRNSHIKKTLREYLPETVQTGSVRHGSRDGNYIFILLCHFRILHWKNIRICRRCFCCKRSSNLDVKRDVP